MSAVRIHDEGIPPALAAPSASPGSPAAVAEWPALLLTAGELARELRCSVKTIDRLQSTGKLPSPQKLGGSRRWRRSEIEAWIAAGMPDLAQWARRCATCRP